MVKNVKLQEITEVSKSARLTVVLFYSKGCVVCGKQKKDLINLEKQLREHGAIFVKINVAKLNKEIKSLPKKDPRRNIEVNTVPTIMMWLNGVNVGWRFEEGGKIFSQINGYTNQHVLVNKIAYLLNG